MQYLRNQWSDYKSSWSCLILTLLWIQRYTMYSLHLNVTMHVCGKFYWNLSTAQRDITSHKKKVLTDNGRPACRTTREHDASRPYCWKRRHNVFWFTVFDASFSGRVLAYSVTEQSCWKAAVLKHRSTNGWQFVRDALRRRRRVSDCPVSTHNALDRLDVARSETRSSGARSVRSGQFFMCESLARGTATSVHRTSPSLAFDDNSPR